MYKPLDLHRKGDAARSSLVVAASVLAAFALVACSPSSEAKGDVGAGEAPEASAQITIDDGSFDPDTIELAAGDEVTVQLRNEDGAPHDFAIETLDINTGTIESGKSAYTTFVMPEEPIEFVCTFHPGMKGQIEPR